MYVQFTSCLQGVNLIVFSIGTKKKNWDNYHSKILKCLKEYCEGHIYDGAFLQK